MSIEIIQTPDGEERRLGCLPPATFPLASRSFAELGKPILTLEQIKATLTRQPYFNRREKFAGDKWVRNQFSAGACNGMSTAAGATKMRFLRGQPYVCLSGFDAYSQMNGGRDNGSLLVDGMKVFENGIAPELPSVEANVTADECVTANQIFDWQISAKAKAARPRFKGPAYYPADTQEEFATALLLGYFGIVAVHATNSYNQMDGDGLSMGGNGVGNHSVLVQDLRLGQDGEINYDQPNSWGLSWADRGHIWLGWNRHLRETVKYHRFWILVDVAEDGKDKSEPPKVQS